jgi:hypothetical protein
MGPCRHRRHKNWGSSSSDGVTLCLYTLYFVFLIINYHILLSIVHTFLHWKWCWNIPCTLYMEGSWERVIIWLLWWLNLQWLILLKLFLKNKNIFFCQKSLWNSGGHYTHMRIMLDKIQYFIFKMMLIFYCHFIPDWNRDEDSHERSRSVSFKHSGWFNFNFLKLTNGPDESGP